MTEDEESELYMSDPRSKSIAAFCEGLAILFSESPNGTETRSALGAEHDEIHIWGDVTLATIPRDSEKGHRLLALGFHTNEELDQWGWYT